RLRVPARGADAPVVLQRRRRGAPARALPARRGAAARARPPPALGARLLRVRATRPDGARPPRPRGAAGVVRAARLLLLEPGRDLRAGRRDPLPARNRRARLRARG